MLTKFEIDTQYYKLSKHFISRDEVTFNTSNLSLGYLIDSNRRLVAISSHPMSCQSLAVFNLVYIPNLFNSSTQQNVSINIERTNCWKLRRIGSPSNCTWEENYNIETVEDFYDIMLVNQKVAVLDRIHDNIDYARGLYKESLTNQNFIYMSKYLEAKEVVYSGITIDKDLKYPYTTGYAKVKGFTLQESAKSIVLQHEIASGFFAESENIRLKYKELVLKEKDIANLKHILEDFQVENTRYASL